MFKVIFSLIMSVLICTIYVLWQYDILKKSKSLEKCHTLLKDLVDVSPILILAMYFNPIAAVFLLGCLVANEFIYDYQVVGALMFMVSYAFASVFAFIQHAFVWYYLLIVIVPIAVIAVCLCKIWKAEKWLKVCGCLYASMAFVPCLYAFLVTKNPGFFCLVAGDILLIVNEIKANKLVKTISDCVYFIGTAMVPISLMLY